MPSRFPIYPITFFNTVGSDIIPLEPLPSSPTPISIFPTRPPITGNPIILSPIPFPPITLPPITSIPRTFVTTFEATPDNWTLDIDFGRPFHGGSRTLTWNRESGIRFTRDEVFFPLSIYVDPNPNFKETITKDPSKPDPTSVPEPVSGLALLGITALGAGSVLKRKDK